MTGSKQRRSLEEAIVDTVREPLIVLDDALRVVVASRSFYRAFAVTPQETEGRLLSELGNGQWDIPALRKLLTAIIPDHTTIEDFEVEHDFPIIGRKIMLLNARKIFYEGNNSTSILVAIEDVTERRALEREKDEGLSRCPRLADMWYRGLARPPEGTGAMGACNGEGANSDGIPGWFPGRGELRGIPV